MELSTEIKEDIRKTQMDLKNAIRLHQVWIIRLQEDEDNVDLRAKVIEAEKEIITIGQNQKRVIERLRRELELYQQRLKARNKNVNIENDNRYIAQQLRDYQQQYHRKTKPVSLIKPSVLSELHVKIGNGNSQVKHIDILDSDSEQKSSNEKENQNLSDSDEKDRYPKNYQEYSNSINNSRHKFASALNKAKESLKSGNAQNDNDWPEQKLLWDSDSSRGPDLNELSPSPSPPPLPQSGEQVSQETFLRLIGLVTPQYKEMLLKKRSERRKRSTTSTNKNDFLYSFESMPKRKKIQFPYLQTHNDPPQTRSAKLRKQQKQSEKSSREGSPSGSSSEKPEREWSNGKKPSWAVSLPTSLTVEPVYPTHKKVCHGCGRNDVPSLMVRCTSCQVYLHTGCGNDGQCSNCQAELPEPPTCGSPHYDNIYRDKLAERKHLQEKNIQLCIDLRKLEERFASLKENLDENNAEKRQLLADQIRTQRNLQKLLDFIGQFKETSGSARSTSVSESGSEVSKSNEE